MSCVKRLRTDLRSDLSAGGTWTYLGYHPTNKLSVSTSNVPTVDIQRIDMSTDNPMIITAGSTVGFYGFNYEQTDDCATTYNTKVYIQIIGSKKLITICDYWLDFNPKIYQSQSLLDKIRISSFKFNNTEYLTEPLGFGTFTKYFLDGSTTVCVTDHNYIRAIPDTLNSIGLADFTVGYSTRAESGTSMYNCEYKYYTLYYLSNSTFEIIFQEDTNFNPSNPPNWVNNSRWTENTVFKWNGISSSWVDQATCNSCVGETMVNNDVVVCS